MGEYRSEKTFKYFYMPMFLCHLLPKIGEDKNKEVLLMTIANFAGKKPLYLLNEWFYQFYPSLVVKNTPEKVDSIISLLEAKFQFDPVFSESLQYQVLILHKFLKTLTIVLKSLM